MVTVTNDFHGTKVFLRADVGDELSPSQIRRSRAALCGISGCTCGGPIGERGPQQGFFVEQIDHGRVKIQAS